MPLITTFFSDPHVYLVLPETRTEIKRVGASGTLE